MSELYKRMDSADQYEYCCKFGNPVNKKINLVQRHVIKYVQIRAPTLYFIFYHIKIIVGFKKLLGFISISRSNLKLSTLYIKEIFNANPFFMFAT